MGRNTKNSRRDRFLEEAPKDGIENSDIATRSSFNFSYFSPTNGGQTFDDWSKVAGSATLLSLCKKLVDYTGSPLSYWETQRAGAGGLKVLSYYKQFPTGTVFKKPNSIPHDVRWGRFRLGNKVRLAGFSIPTQLDGQLDDKGRRLSSNIFYVVYLDKEHEFYPVEAH
ncbi:hypothetical protein F2Z80_08070 [Vibrio fortis]|uniref:Uncharacterized protein n=1 Tax=Vibrio fortis TaxID=212667 RepID=A0A5N3SCK0_9VIBR|nr:hypothetical protein [Vibrio fortis]KAB0303895.1 hypothetical protein F2Z80_08070 [Vibrio fortis]